MKHCPNCQAMLEEAVFGTVSIDGCPRCGGTWFEGQELTKVAQKGHYRQLAEIERHFQETRPEGMRRPPAQKLCPVCAVPLFQFHFTHTPDVHLDGCRQCKGIWVDDGKLLELQVRLARLYGEAPAAAPEAKPAPTPQPAPPGTLEVPCPGCNEYMPVTLKVCSYCHTELPTTHADTPRRCPICNEALMSETRAGLRVQRCFNQCGLWLHSLFFQELVHHHRDLLVQMDQGLPPAADVERGAGKPLSCSACQTSMLTYELIVPLQKMYNFSTGIQVSRCPLCNGMWFLPGQMTEIQKRLMAREAELKAEEEAQQEAWY